MIPKSERGDDAGKRNFSTLVASGSAANGGRQVNDTIDVRTLLLINNVKMGPFLAAMELKESE